MQPIRYLESLTWQILLLNARTHLKIGRRLSFTQSDTSSTFSSRIYGNNSLAAGTTSEVELSRSLRKQSLSINCLKRKSRICSAIHHEWRRWIYIGDRTLDWLARRAVLNKHQGCGMAVKYDLTAISQDTLFSKLRKMRYSRPRIQSCWDKNPSALLAG